MSSWLIYPSPPMGHGRRIELPGIDLWILARIDNAFVFPDELNIDRFKDALSRTLSLWPVICGRFLLLENGKYIIEMSDNPIPVSYAENNELAKWPNESKVVFEFNRNPLGPFIDEVQSTKLISGSHEVPLVCFKLTRIVQSGEWVLGTSWEHTVGDAASCAHFLNTLSRIYQQLSPSEPLPIFERRLWREEESDQSLVPMMKYLRDAWPLQEMLKNFMINQSKYDQLNLQFSGEQLYKLRELAGGNEVTIQDSLTAYIIVTLNTYFYRNYDESIILRANNTIDCRGVSDSIASAGQISNALVVMLSDNFEDPFSLSSIAKTIRRSIIRSRDPQFLERWLATADLLMKNITFNNLTPKIDYFPNEIMVNSNLRFDWSELVDFGYHGKCRFYTAWTGPLYLRVFRLNPIQDEIGCFKRDQNGAEVAFLIDKGIKEPFVNAWQKDIAENFENVKR